MGRKDVYMRNRSTRCIAAAGLIGGLALAPLAVHGAGRPQPVVRHIDMIYVSIVNTSTTDAISRGGASYTPDQGNEFLVVKIQAVNKNDVQLAVNPSDFTLVNTSGGSINPYYENIGSPFSQTVLDPNGFTSGTVTYQVPKASRLVTLRWSPQPNMSSERWPTASWSIRY